MTTALEAIIAHKVQQLTGYLEMDEGSQT